MQPLDTYHLFINIVVVVMMPLIIWANLRSRGAKSPVHAYLWREHPNLMRAALLIITLLTLFSATALLADFGIISPAAEETTTIVIGVPFMIAAVAMIGLSAAAAVKGIRTWRAGRKAS